MKLRNKKTGKIHNFIIDGDEIRTSNLCSIYTYNSIAELFEEWEDYEEPKDNNYWYIDDFGRIQFSSEVLDEVEGRPNNWIARKLFGNYFETKEEAEKAVEKLKAWKRLKDKKIKIGKRSHSAYGGEMYWKCPSGTGVSDNQIWLDLELLFGGEE